jgi:hypothetical protein
LSGLIKTIHYHQSIIILSSYLIYLFTTNFY